MISTRSVSGIAVTTAVLLMTAACGSDSDTESTATITSTTTTTKSADDQRSSAATTTSSVVSSALNTAQQMIQDAINAALAAAPITFDSGSSDLSTADVAAIRAVALTLKGNDAKIEVKTYAEDSDSDTADALAEARGNNIMNELESAGVDKERISVKAEGNPDTSDDVQVDEADVSVVPEE
ncbi:OmpA family protein [Nocardia sp. 004]|uniref:OmpA family protein n=1 Tax=Nocardia sp. 004 TaxID=3385978 RepID=UPI0039A3578B